ncbi:MAG: choice-of-anchor J domain-containing protein [Bacteroidetes bacterium]|nr:choice-of-anchor J domain-containing protein [Bacteroidota bacterium]
MKRFVLPILVFLCLFSLSSRSQVVFKETFDNAGPTNFPNGWSLYNVDALTPAASVSYINNAWIRREDFAFNVGDSAAFSTSWYVPAGQADDWMWTPAITLSAPTVLKWNAVAYDPLFRDGYEVRIMTTAPTMANQLTSTVLFSTAAENSTWTTHTADLSAYAGQTVYIGFRNNSTDKFLLLIDDIEVDTNFTAEAFVANTDPISEYTQIPLSQAAAMSLNGRITNNGTDTLHNVIMVTQVLDANAQLVATTASFPLATLAPGVTDSFSAGTWKPTDSGMYTIKYFNIQAEIDQNPVNDTVYQYIHITDTLYARDNDTVAAQLGIGAGNGGYLGNEFRFYDTARVKSLIMHVTRGYTGERMALCIWNIDTTTGKPDTIVAVTDTLTYPDDSARTYEIAMHDGVTMLMPGRYAVTAIEFDSTLSVGLSNNIFTSGRTWVNWPTSPFGGWANLEAFGASFAKTPMIRVVLKDTLFGPLDIVLNSFNARAGNCSNTISASFNITHDQLSATLQHSTDGKTFENLQGWKLNETGDINYVHATGDEMMHYYRFAYKGSDNQPKFTYVLPVQSSCGTATNSSTLYPNPLSGTSLTVAYQAEGNEQLHLSLIDINGRTVRDWEKTANEGSNMIKLDLDDINEGQYALRIIHGDGKVEVLRLQKVKQ